MKYLNNYSLFEASENSIVPQTLLLKRSGILTKNAMIMEGGTGALNRAFERYIPIYKIKGEDPEPGNWTDDDGVNHFFKKGFQIKTLIEVIYNNDDDVYYLQNGNHRLKQAKLNNQNYIAAFVEPDKGKIGDAKFKNPDLSITESKTQLEEEVEELKNFQNDLDINSNINKLLKSINAVQLDIKTIYPNIDETMDISDLEDDSKFLKYIQNNRLRLSELFDTDDSATLIKRQLKYYWVYTADSIDLEMPVYIIFQWINKDNTLSPLFLYLVQNDTSNFYKELSCATMTIKQKSKKSNKWIYISSNSGKNWTLQNKDDATSSFKKILNSDEVEALAKHPHTEITFS